MEEVILVDTHDKEIGRADKVFVVQKGLLHRAVSVCLFDGDQRWLLQRRAETKYHSPGLLANSCCSHPLPGETVLAAAERRVQQELGVQCRLQFCCSFVYKADVGQGLTEHEYDHVFTGAYFGAFSPNIDEVSEVQWWTTDQIEDALQKRPEIFAAWFPLVFKRVKASFSKMNWK